MQEAYFSERNTYGGWQTIGYTAPGTSAADDNGSGYTPNFTYTGGFDKTTTDETSGDGWQAANRSKLNDCDEGSTWTVALIEPSGNTDGYSTTVDGGAGCSALTPTFDLIDGTN
jgi:hypothetical protein